MPIGIVDGKQTHRPVIEMHKGKPHIRTEVVFLTPIPEEEVHKFSALMLTGEFKGLIQDTLDKVEEVIGDTFESDVESVYTSFKNIL